MNVTYDYSGKVVLVTGGGRGQGLSHALGFAAAGADVAICEPGEQTPSVPYPIGGSDDLESAAQQIRALGVRCLPAICDVRDERQVAALLDDVDRELGRLDVVVNNAGVDSVHEVVDMPVEAWDELIDTNLKGVFLIAKHAIPRILATGDGGTIVNIGSTNSLGGTPKQAHYTAAKHGVIGFTKGLAIELAPQGITVNTVCPGGVDSPMVSGLLASPYGEWLETMEETTGRWNLIAPEEMLRPNDITAAVLWLASDAARFVTGATLSVDAGFTIK